MMVAATVLGFVMQALIRQGICAPLLKLQATLD